MTSPTLKTLLTGHEAGTAKTSPRKDRCGCATAVELANAARSHLGLRVVAEGVESPDVRGRLTTLGCDQAHGYSFSRALPQADFAAWLTARELSELALSA